MSKKNLLRKASSLMISSVLIFNSTLVMAMENEKQELQRIEQISAFGLNSLCTEKNDSVAKKLVNEYAKELRENMSSVMQVMGDVREVFSGDRIVGDAAAFSIDSLLICLSGNYSTYSEGFQKEFNEEALTDLTLKILNYFEEKSRITRKMQRIHGGDWVVVEEKSITIPPSPFTTFLAHHIPSSIPGSFLLKGLVNNKWTEQSVKRLAIKSIINLIFGLLENSTGKTSKQWVATGVSELMNRVMNRESVLKKEENVQKKEILIEENSLKIEKSILYETRETEELERTALGRYTKAIFSHYTREFMNHTIDAGMFEWAPCFLSKMLPQKSVTETINHSAVKLLSKSSLLQFMGTKVLNSVNGPAIRVFEQEVRSFVKKRIDCALYSLLPYTYTEHCLFHVNIDEVNQHFYMFPNEFVKKEELKNTNLATEVVKQIFSNESSLSKGAMTVLHLTESLWTKINSILGRAIKEDKKDKEPIFECLQEIDSLLMKNSENGLTKTETLDNFGLKNQLSFICQPKIDVIEELKKKPSFSMKIDFIEDLSNQIHKTKKEYLEIQEEKQKKLGEEVRVQKKHRNYIYSFSDLLFSALNEDGSWDSHISNKNHVSLHEKLGTSKLIDFFQGVEDALLSEKNKDFGYFEVCALGTILQDTRLFIELLRDLKPENLTFKNEHDRLEKASQFLKNMIKKAESKREDQEKKSLSGKIGKLNISSEVLENASLFDGVPIKKVNSLLEKNNEILKKHLNYLDSLYDPENKEYIEEAKKSGVNLIERCVDFHVERQRLKQLRFAFQDRFLSSKGFYEIVDMIYMGNMVESIPQRTGCFQAKESQTVSDYLAEIKEKKGLKALEEKCMECASMLVEFFKSKNSEEFYGKTIRKNLTNGTFRGLLTTDIVKAIFQRLYTYAKEDTKLTVDSKGWDKINLYPEDIIEKVLVVENIESTDNDSNIVKLLIEDFNEFLRSSKDTKGFAEKYFETQWDEAFQKISQEKKDFVEKHKPEIFNWICSTNEKDFKIYWDLSCAVDQIKDNNGELLKFVEGSEKNVFYRSIILPNLGKKENNIVQVIENRDISSEKDLTDEKSNAIDEKKEISIEGGSQNQFDNIDNNVSKNEISNDTNASPKNSCIIS